ncbi:hypothetical protein SEA_KUDEFRE_144 [Gordonia phage Kudefre]|uniref:Uncharacterized protein n=1 Tax=Gordonia phage Kudefre TaxID=2885975 RepID=A0AAE8Y6G4_9CAUD|nr:hypothetical protein L3Y24_gp099 [Gordonia phage Kudefre]UDL15375.1 hypothetical protein SEA_KUDEFRE_144 [Gordonia phage Kudefre]
MWGWALLAGALRGLAVRGASLGAFRVCGACRGRGLSLGYRCSSHPVYGLGLAKRT